MRQSPKETLMLHMQAELVAAPRESGAMLAEACRGDRALAAWSGDGITQAPWLKPGR